MSYKPVVIKNKKAFFEYEILDQFTCGIQLQGTEVKSLRLGKASIVEAYCYFNNGELFVKNMHIAEYSHGNIYNHEPTRNRKLLLHKKELEKLATKVKDVGISIVPLKLFFSEKGWAKLEIGLARGKKIHDKRESLKAKDNQRQMQRAKNQF